MQTGLYSKKPVTVVEIGNDWLKVVENSPSSSGRVISKASFTKLASINDTVSAEVARVFKNLNLSKQGVITYVPRHLVTARVLEFPSTDPKEINDMVSLQVSKQTPYSKEEIFSTHKTLSSDKEGYTKVMLVIARRNIVTERVETLQKAGVEVSRVAVSTEGAYNWFTVAYPSEMMSEPLQANVVLDVDSNYSDFIIIRKEGTIFTRSILIGANQLVDEFDKWQDKFVEEVGHSVELYQGEQRGSKIGKIFLIGAGKGIKGLADTLGAKLGIPVEAADQTKNMRIKPGLNLPQDPNLNLVSASALFGIAIKHKEISLDLTPSGLRMQRRMEDKRKQLVITGALLALIVTFLSLILLTNIYSKNAYLKELKDRISRIEKDANDIEKMRQKIAVVEKRLDARGASINILMDIYRLTPKEIYMTSISIEEKNKATIKGRASALSDVYKYAKTLEDSSLFEKVNTNYANTKREDNIEYADFEIVCFCEKK